VKFRNLTVLLEELLSVLPTRAKPEWQKLSDINPQKPTVVLVSGFAATRRNLSVIRKRLLKDGFNVIVLPLDWQALADGVKGLYRMSEKLSSVILELRKGPCRGNAKVYVVAHSAGGLVARYYIQLLGGFHYCDGLVTLATPHRGTWFAALGLLSHLILKARCLMQMVPVSPFIKRINAAPFPQDFRWLSISSRDDLLCPRRATKLPDLLEHSTSLTAVELKGLSHRDFLLSKLSYRLMVTYLRDEVPVEAETVPLIPVILPQTT
jgi:triacylglycerol esterase/lipase EstA (alpha/beta hydrolase family)